MEWIQIWRTGEKPRTPPIETWVEFYDGEKTMRDSPLHYIDKIDKYGDCDHNYLHNYTHWRFLSAPNT